MAKLGSLSSSELVDYLLDEGISDHIISRLDDNDIDGETLLFMVTDLEEFKDVLPKAGDRLAIKKLIQRVTTTEKQGSNGADTPEQGSENFTDTLSVDITGDDMDESHAIQTENHTGDRKRKNQENSVDPPPKRKPLEDANMNMPPVFNVNKITLPHFSSKTKKAIESGDIVLELPRARFVRECVAYYEPILPRPTGEQYTAIAKVLLKEYPCLRDKGTIYWATLKEQITMRYRNNRRGSTAAKHQKLKGVKLPPGVVKPSNDEVSSNDIDNQESIEALQKLFEGRASAPSATVQSLLDETRGHRNEWLQRAVSIHTILKTYPVFKLPKWLIYEFQQILGEPIRDKFEKNWLTICGKFGGGEQRSFEKEVEVIKLLTANIFYKPPAQNVVEVTPATGNIEDHFVSPILEPRLIVFTDNGGLAQMILCAENEEIVEVPGETLVEGLIHLMASYYVFGVEYPKMCRALLFFFQDILMERPDMHGPAKSRPTRYKTFISRL